jgi:glycosyltransferase involved in cell wall biosynthesis
MSAKLISVVLPTHNRKYLLKRAISSVINQTFKNIEIIIVDDGSTDGTQEDYSNEYMGVKYIRIDPPKGGNFARNTGIANARGDFIAFLDDDDEWLPAKLEKQLALFERDGSVGLVYTGVEVLHGTKTSYCIKPKLKGDLSKLILTFNYIGTTSSVMIRKAVFDDVGKFDTDMPQLQDYDLWIRVCQKYKIDFVPESLVKYYIHNDGSQVTSSLSKNQKAIEIIDEKYADLIEALSSGEQKKRFCQRYNAMGKRLLNSGDRSGSRRYFFRSFLAYPNLVSVKFYVASFFSYQFLIKVRNFLSH